jgi:hypothetical protein
MQKDSIERQLHHDYCEMVENATMAPNRQSISVQFDRAGTASDDLLKHVD